MLLRALAILFMKSFIAGLHAWCGQSSAVLSSGCHSPLKKSESHSDRTQLYSGCSEKEGRGSKEIMEVKIRGGVEEEEETEMGGRKI